MRLLGRRPAMRTARREAGQASVEFIGLVPLVLFVLVIALQVMAFAYAAHAASQAARDGARAYSLQQSPQGAVQASLPGGVRLVSVSTYGPDHGVRVTVASPLLLPVGDRTVTRSVTMP